MVRNFTNRLLGLLICWMIGGAVQGQTHFKVVDFEGFQKLVTTSEPGKLSLYNFWATWCAPCIKEMPHFEKTAEKDSMVELFFISMDNSRKLDRVDQFIEKRKVQSPVYLLDDVDFNSWIDKVSPDWSGAIPATLFVLPGGDNYFHEGEMSEEELQQLIIQLKEQ